MSWFGSNAKWITHSDRLRSKNRRTRKNGQSPRRPAALSLRPAFEHLEERQLLSAVGGGWAADFLPGSLVYSSAVYGELSSVLEKDVYSFELDADQTITAVVHGDVGLQPSVYIRDAKDQVLSSGAAGGVGESAVAQTAAVQKAGCYTIEVAGLAGTLGQYDIEITLNAAAELEAEGLASNDTRTAAQSIDGSFCELSGGAAYRGAVAGSLETAAADADWFSFTLAAGDPITLLVAADPGYEQTAPGVDARPRLELYNSLGTRLAVGIDVDMPPDSESPILAQAIENYVAASGGTYYARLSGQDLEYSFIVASGCAFDLGNNSAPAEGSSLLPWEGGAYQDISGRGGVLGGIGNAGAGWTVMVYIDADNNLEGAGIEDFLEIAAVGSSEDVKIVVQMDRLSGYDYSYDNWTTARRGLVNQGDVPDTGWGEDIGEVDMGDPETVIDFIDWTMREYPSANYAIIYWDHGNGIEGVCADYTSGGELDVADMTAVIEAAPAVDMVGFDACLMAMLEIGYQYAGGADVMVASEASEWLDGWEYQNFLDKLLDDPTMDAATLGGHIIDAFADRYDYNADSTLSAVDLTQITSPSSSLIASLDGFAGWMLSSATADDWEAVELASNQARRWDEPAYIDLGDFISRVNQQSISSELHSITAALLAAVDSVVLEAYGGTYAPCTGLSIYLPQLYGYISPSYNQDLNFLADTRWDDFVTLFASSTRVAYAQTSVTYGPAKLPPRNVLAAPCLQLSAGGIHRKTADSETQSDRSSGSLVSQSQTSAGESAVSGDWYCVEMNAGDWMTLWTTTPGGEDYDFFNLFDPYIELYGPDGQLLAADDNTVYGRNALITYTAASDGRYWIRVDSSPLNSTTGQYYLRIIGPSGAAAPLCVSETDLPDGSRQDEQPASVEVEFTDQILLTTLNYSDLTIDGTLHSVGCSVIDGNTIRFTLPTGLCDGSHEIGFSAGSIRDIQGTPIEDTFWTFYIGSAPPRIVAASIHDGDDLPAGISVFEAEFDMPLDGDALDVSDAVLVGVNSGPITPVGLYYNPENFKVSIQFPSLGVDDYTLTLFSGFEHFEAAAEEGLYLDGELGDGPGGLPTGDGNPGGDFVIDFTLSGQSQVLGRYVAYNNSAWDGNDAAAGADDDQAIAVDKQALLPGETASFENYTSYVRGINAVMIDVGFVPEGVQPGIDDFSFLVGNNDDPGSWTEAPDPLDIALRRGDGAGGSDRITVIWADGAISNQWLQVTVYAQRLGLVEDDVFYWGNAIAESGDSAAHALVNASDVLAASDNPCGPDPPAEIANPYDYNRDCAVDQSDVAIAQANTTSLFTALRLITTPEIVARTSSSTPPDVSTSDANAAADAVFAASPQHMPVIQHRPRPHGPAKIHAGREKLVDLVMTLRMSF